MNFWKGLGLSPEVTANDLGVGKTVKTGGRIRYITEKNAREVLKECRLHKTTDEYGIPWVGM